MRDDVIESVLIGCMVGLLALAIRAFTSEAAPLIQLLLLLLAGLVLAAIQLVISNRKNRQHSRPKDAMSAPVPPPIQPRRNQFMRELASDWVGLEDTPPAPPAEPAEEPETEPVGAAPTSPASKD